MKRMLITTLAITGFAIASSAQIVSMEIGASGDISGTQYDVTSAGAEVVIEVHVNNLTSDSMDLEISREWLNPIASWRDYICWGHESDIFGGKCYPVDSVNTIFTGDTPVMVHENEGGILSIHILPNAPDFGCGVYRYRVLEAGVELDYLDVSVCKTLDVTEAQPELSFSVAPNPANSVLTIHSTPFVDAHLIMTDALGNVVLNSTYNGSSKTLDISKFTNGIYFLSIQTQGVEQLNRKISIQH